MARVLPGAVLEGFKEASRKLRQIPEETRELLYQAVRETAFSLSRRAMANAPRASGTLRNAITYDARGLSGRVRVQPQGFYWRFHEYGTRFIPATGFARAAAEAENTDVQERARRIAQKVERNFEAGRLL